MTAPDVTGERPALRTVAPAPLLTALLAALAVAGAVARLPERDRVPFALGAGTAALLLCAAVALAAYALQKARAARRRLEAVTQDAGRLLQERVRQSAQFDQERVRLTEELTHERARHAAELAQERLRLTAAFEQDRARLTAENARLAEQARRADRERATAVSATANAAGRMQALATGMLADLRAMEERHEDEDVLADLLHLDHRTAQAGRLADSVAVLAGARSGRRWARPISMESILRGAMGRIGGYQRVRVHSASEAAVAGHAAEGVMHALAELLDNAANFSPPTAEVHVYVEEVPAGVIVSVEDSGLVMGEVQLRRAERAVRGDEAELGGLTGTRLGLAVVGRLARKYGLKVSFRPSARGGTGALVLVPQDILVPEPHTDRPAPATHTPGPRTGRPESGTRTPEPGNDTPEPHAGHPAPGPHAPRPQTGHPEPGTHTPEPHTSRPEPGNDTSEPHTGHPGAGTRTPGPRTDHPEPLDEHPRRSYEEHPGGSYETRHSTPHPQQHPHARSLPHQDPGAGSDPVRTHHRESAGRDADRDTDADRDAGRDADGDTGAVAGVSGLPKRRRGRALAEAERERERARARAAGSGATGPGAAPDPLDDPLARAARFSSFRRAVRGSLSDQGTPVPGEDTSARTSAPSATPRPNPHLHPHPDPEGNSTS
ncbi:sensor histidine kinase [Streptomyces sp. MCC20]|uniref:sensor histidine kinase n=1 Tax=Streptomyces sediminimaris TaxID=3383721 RepID=UPI0039994FCB